MFRLVANFANGRRVTVRRATFTRCTDAVRFARKLLDADNEIANVDVHEDNSLTDMTTLLVTVHAPIPAPLSWSVIDTSV